MELKELAKELYFKNVTVEKYRDNFLKELSARTVVDKTQEGFYCSSCSKFSKVQQMPLLSDKVIFPRNNDTEIWIVNSHYDGCMCWD